MNINNNIIVIGRLTKDPEIRVFTNSENKSTTIARFTVAVDKRNKDKGTNFFSCVAFGKTAEFAEKYLKKGTKMVVSGEMNNETYQATDGDKRTIWEITVDQMTFAESKGNNTEPIPAKDADGFMTIPESINEDLPFAAPNR